MKHLLPLFLIALLGGMVGCSEAEEVVVRSLQLSAGSVVFDAAGGEQALQVSPFPEEEAWAVRHTGEPAWFDFRVAGNTLYVTAEANEQSSARRDRLELVSPSGAFAPYEVTILQEAAEALRFSTNAEATYSFDSEGGSFSFQISANQPWSLSTEAAWITLEEQPDAERATLSAAAHTGDEKRSGVVLLTVGEGAARIEQEIAVEQSTRAENPYLRLLGKWEITATKWFYSPNGSLNSLDFSPSATEYYLIFDMEPGVYGESLYMRNFLYPGTSLEVRYDKESGGIIIPFGWSVYAYEVFLYITCVGDSSFSYAAQEVTATPSESGSSLHLLLPSVSGFNYVGFGLWTYNDSGSKVAFGSRSYPTMFPMGTILFNKQQS